MEHREQAKLCEIVAVIHHDGHLDGLADLDPDVANRRKFRRVCHERVDQLPLVRLVEPGPAPSGHGAGRLDAWSFVPSVGLGADAFSATLR
jgi:hypothetical protein